MTQAGASPSEAIREAPFPQSIFPQAVSPHPHSVLVYTNDPTRGLKPDGLLKWEKLNISCLLHPMVKLAHLQGVTQKEAGKVAKRANTH